MDASVFLSAFNPSEPDHEDSSRFLDRLRQMGAPIAVPTLLLPEVAGAIARVRQEPTVAAAFAQSLARLSAVILVSLDPGLARRAAEIAARQKLRGSDAVYTAVAERFGSFLVTLDREQRQGAAAVVPAYSPSNVPMDPR